MSPDSVLHIRQSAAGNGTHAIRPRIAEPQLGPAADEPRNQEPTR